MPALVIVQAVPDGPSMPSAAAPVDVTLPVLVMVRGLFVLPRVTGPLMLVLIVLPLTRASCCCWLTKGVIGSGLVTEGAAP